MHRHPFNRLAVNLTAAMAALAVAVTQPILSMCRCSADSSAAASDVSAASSYCGSACHGERSATCCCTPQPIPAGGSPICPCLASADQTPAPPPSGPLRVTGADAVAWMLPAIASLADSGLHGAAWATAFDGEASSGPRGVRLHALLSVWRN
jgi:hypothetical protein